MAFGIPRIDDVYKCIPTPGQLFTNEYGEAPDWVLSPEGEGGAKRIITPWPANCDYNPPSPRDGIDERTEESTRLQIPEECLISELASGQSGDQQSQPMPLWQAIKYTAECGGSLLQGRQDIRPGPTRTSRMQQGRRSSRRKSLWHRSGVRGEAGPA